MRRLAVATAVASVATWAFADTWEDRFRAATAAVRAGDALGGILVFRELAAEGVATPSLYWNWAQAAALRGQVGEAVWALLRCRQLDPRDPVVGRELERLRQLANLSAAELAPQPLAELAHQARRWRLGSLAVGFFVFSLLLHILARGALTAARWPVAGAWTALVLALVLSFPAAAIPLLARPLATVVRPGAQLFDSVSPQAGTLAQLREGEVVPILGRSGQFVRIQDSSGARGWARQDEVWPLDELPPANALP